MEKRRLGIAAGIAGGLVFGIAGSASMSIHGREASADIARQEANSDLGPEKSKLEEPRKETKRKVAKVVRNISISSEGAVKTTDEKAKVPTTKEVEDKFANETAHELTKAFGEKGFVFTYNTRMSDELSTAFIEIEVGGIIYHLAQANVENMDHEKKYNLVFFLSTKKQHLSKSYIKVNDIKEVVSVVEKAMEENKL